MKINPHKSATTTPATRGCIQAYIQASTKTAVALSAELGVSMTAIYKWKHAGRTQDGSHTRHNLGASALPQHEAIIREPRVDPCLSLDDIVEVMNRRQPVALSRGCLVASLPAALGPQSTNQTQANS